MEQKYIVYTELIYKVLDYGNCLLIIYLDFPKIMTYCDKSE